MSNKNRKAFKGNIVSDSTPMSCGARLPIWMLLIPAFFAPNLQAPALFGIYPVGSDALPQRRQACEETGFAVSIVA